MSIQSRLATATDGFRGGGAIDVIKVDSMTGAEAITQFAGASIGSISSGASSKEASSGASNVIVSAKAIIVKGGAGYGKC